MNFKDINGNLHNINDINDLTIINNNIRNANINNLDIANNEHNRFHHLDPNIIQQNEVKHIVIPSMTDTSILPDYMSLECLPDEILMLIFSRIKDMKILENLRLCSKMINALIGYNFADINIILNHGIKIDSIFFVDIAFRNGIKFTNKDALKCLETDSVKCLKYMYNNGCQLYDIIWIYVGKYGSVKCYDYLKQIGIPDTFNWAQKNDVIGRIKLC